MDSLPDQVGRPLATAGGPPSERSISLGSVRRLAAGWNIETRIGAVIVGVLILVALLAPLISPAKPDSVNIINALQSPSLAHPFGTDYVGRDVFTRTIY